MTVTTFCKQPFGQWARATALAAAAALAACGGGGDDDTSTTTQPAQASALQGTAAVGAPIAGGTVQARCAGGGMLQAVTAANGAWTIDTTGQTLPCGVRVSGGSLPAGQAYHAVALTFGTVNITPLTDLLTANLLGQVPTLWWGANGPTSFGAVTEQAVEQALARLRSALALAPLQSRDPQTTAFQAASGDVIDDMLEALQRALAGLPMDYAALLSAASSAGFTVPDTFRTALQNAYTLITTGSGGGTGGTGGGTGTNTGGTGGTGPGIDSGSGNHTLVLSITAGGVSAGDITITNIAKPSNQQEFCGAINDPSSGIGLTQAVPGGSGSVTIQSCSFDGNVGRVNATLTISSPIAMTVPYAVTYTFR